MEATYEPVWPQGFTFIWLSRTIIVNHVDAHFEALFQMHRNQEQPRYPTLTVPLSTRAYKCLLLNCWGDLKKCEEMTCNGLASRPGGVEILAPSRFMPQKPR